MAFFESFFTSFLTVAGHNLPSLLDGARVTIQCAFLAEGVALIVGLGLTLVREWRIPIVNGIVGLYMSFIRGTPSLIQIFIVYYVIPAMTGLSLTPFQAGFIAVGLNSAAFVTEILRGGLTGIPQGQIEAAKAVGMSTVLLWQRILLPQLWVLTLPGLVSEFVIAVQDSSLLSVISLVELTRRSQQIVAATGQPLEIYGLTGGIYLVISLSVSVLARRLYRKKIAVYQIV